MSYYQCIDCSVKLPFKRDLESVIKMGFWPGTPSNFCHLFDRDLLVYWDMAQKRMPGVSERSFITSLEDFSLAKGRVGLYSTAQKEVWDIHVTFRFKTRWSTEEIWAHVLFSALCASSKSYFLIYQKGNLGLLCIQITSFTLAIAMLNRLSWLFSV